jgi:radical SAM protein with 4Fe4S-binding SPASM domain
MPVQFEELSAEDEFYFQWHITERCNWRCRHCYQNDKPTDELAVGDLLRIAGLMGEAAEKWGKRGSVSLTGGEPFLRADDLHQLMVFLDSSTMFAHYDILTNGSLITEREAGRMIEHPKLRRVQVSLEGAAAQANDDIRGQGAFEKTIEAIHVLRSRDIEISVMTTITRKNKGQIGALVELLDREGVAALALERFIPEGNGLGLSSEVLSREEIHSLYSEIYEMAQVSPIRLLLYRPLFTLTAPDDPTVGALCSAGNNALTIMPDGTVFPCRRLPIPIGNVLRDGLYKIWYGSELLWKLRDPDNLKGKCRSCELLTQCRGCRAMAYFLTGDYLSEDPQCWKL